MLVCKTEQEHVMATLQHQHVHTCICVPAGALSNVYKNQNLRPAYERKPSVGLSGC